MNKLKSELDSVIVSIFPKLNITDKKILSEYVSKLIDIIYNVFCFSNIDVYIEQLKQNDYQDIKWLIFHLLPYLNNNNITSLSDIYHKKEKEVNINSELPKYTYSNLQYNRCIRTPDNYTEKPFNIEDINHNFYLLVESIKQCSNKLYPNWMNILPYTIKSYKKSLLYLETQKRIFIEFDVTNFNDIPRGLYIGHIYEELVDLYYSIKDYKWLIYDIKRNNKIIYMTEYLVILFPNIYKLFLKDQNWDKLTMENKNYFDKQITDFLNNPQEDYANKLQFIKSLILSYEKLNINENKTYISIESQSGIKYEVDTDDEDIGNYNKIDEELLNQYVLKSFKSLESKFIYNYICESIQKIKNTWYGYYLLNESKTELQSNINPNLNPNPIQNQDEYIDISQFRIKNIYNFAKSLVIEFGSNRKFIPYPTHWISLLSSQKQKIIEKLQMQIPTWFNIKGYIRRLYGNDNVNNMNLQIYKTCQWLLVDIIFQSLIHKGALTQIIPDARCAKKLYKNNNLELIVENKKQIEILSQSDTNEYWTSSYHFLTNLRYKDMNNANFLIQDKYNFFAYSLIQPWYVASSYDWISQIGFCHHFINNRVTFLTGDTGIGKSTEIPKLYLYYSCMIHNIKNPKIVCTEPRRNAVGENARRVSDTFGVPISKNHKYIQYKFKGDKEHVGLVYGPSLLYITGDSLMFEINEPLLKNKSKSGEYYKTNKYDIILIDEAHEHKIHMDLLLSFLKLPIYLNNSVKLVIVSATMDEDESNYRRFYRDINDNQKYPLNNWIADNKIDRINVDRRYHISSPGATTRFPITEHYIPNINPTNINSTIKDIINKTISGDILIFEPGVKEIMDLITYLNQNIPSNMIAIPYYRDLNDSKQKIIQNIQNMRQLIKIDKSENFSTAGFSKGNNTYQRVVIVSTNIAEASITIPSLEYMIDTGTEKYQRYDYQRRGEELVSGIILSLVENKGEVVFLATKTSGYCILFIFTKYDDK